jgi:DNA-binding NtrC family response regulator
MDKILIVEDELIVARDLRKTLEKAGYKVIGVSRTAEGALSMIQEDRPSLVLVDIFLKGDLTGIDLASRLNEEDIPFIYISANSNQSVLEAAKSTHPYGFIVKPFRARDLLVSIDIAQYRYEHNKELNKRSPAHQADPASPARDSGKGTPAPVKRFVFNYDDFIGRSAVMLKVFNQIQQVAPFDTSVLLLGESGTGKEVVANYIYKESGRNHRPFIKINCAAVPSGLMETDFFGYEKGAFTGAAERKPGKFELAAGGTILLDEIGEMPLDIQAKLLRVLQEKEIQRIGGNTMIKTDVRIIAATNRNLEMEIAAGRFRLDLYYRLHVFPIVLPPLRQRKEDIPLLIDHFIDHYNRTMGKNITGVDKAVLQRLLGYNWPGNVRELQFLIERSILMANDDTIREILLPEEHPDLIKNIPAADSQKAIEEIEKTHILSILEQCNFKISGKGGAAELLNLQPSVLYAKIKKFGIKRFFY